MSIPKISACIITFNDAERLRICLEAIKDHVDEIVVVDSFSNDNSLEVAREFTSKVYQEPFESYSSQHNKASAKATNEWVCNIEVDELFTKELWNAIREEFKKGSHKKYNAFCFPRKTFVIKTKEHYREQVAHLDREKDFIFLPRSYPNFIDRLHRKNLKFVGDVHPKLALEGKRKFIPTPVFHYNILRTKEEHEERANRKKKPLSSETLALYTNKKKMARRFIKDNIFYFNSFVFGLKFYKSPKKIAYILRWFFAYYKLCWQLITKKSPHKKE